MSSGRSVLILFIFLILPFIGVSSVPFKPGVVNKSTGAMWSPPSQAAKLLSPSENKSAVQGLYTITLIDHSSDPTQYSSGNSSCKSPFLKIKKGNLH